MKKFSKIFIVSFMLLLSSVLYAGCKEKKEATLHPTVSLEEGNYFLTTQTLEDVEIKLGDNDTAGKIEWADPSLTIKLGVNEYEWNFTPDSDKYKSASGKIEITGYKLISWQGVEPISFNYTGSDLKDSLCAYLDSIIPSEDMTVEVLNEEQLVGKGVHQVTIRVTPKNYRLISLSGTNYETFITPNIELQIGKSLPTIANIQSVDYDGNSHVPSLVVGELTAEDYSVTWEYSVDNTNYVEYDTANGFVNAGSYKATIEGKGNYFGTVTKQYIINRAVMKEINAIESLSYTGSELSPEIVIAGLTEGVDYDLSWDKDSLTDVGTYTVTATGKGNYTGEVKKSFTINKATNSWVDSLSIEDWVYGETEETPLATAKFGTVSYKYFSDSTCLTEIDAPTNAGTYYVKAFVTGNDNYSSIVSEAEEFSIEKATPSVSLPTDLKAIAGDSLESVVLPTGFAWVSPTDLVGEQGERTHKANYTANDNNYKDVVVDIVITVSPKIAEVSPMNSAVYTGSSKTPTVTLEGLTEGEDYAISWKFKRIGEQDSEYEDLDITVAANKFKAAGDYKVVVTGLNDYAGQTTSAVYTIAKADYSISVTKYANMYVGDCVKDITITSLTGTTISWDSEHADYNTALIAGTNTRYAKFSGNDNYNANDSLAVTLVATRGCASSVEDINTLNENDDIKYIHIDMDLEVEEDIILDDSKILVVDKEVTLTIKAGYSITVSATPQIKGTVLTNAEHMLYEAMVKAGQTGLEEPEQYGDLIQEISSGNKLRAAFTSGANIVRLTADIDNIGFSCMLGTKKNVSCMIDLNGYDITGELEVGNMTKNSFGTMPYTDCSINLMIGNTSSNASKVISNVDYALSVFGNDKVKVMIENVEFEGVYGGLYTNGSAQYNGSMICAINSQFISNSGAGAYLASDYLYMFNGCTFEGGNGAIIKSGSMTLVNCDLTGTAEQSEITYNANGANLTGDALLIESSTGYADNLNVIIYGGEFISTNGYGVQEGYDIEYTSNSYAFVQVNGFGSDLDDTVFKFSDDAIIEIVG